MDKNTKVLIWSIEHDAWWAPNHNGYVLRKELAGEYTLEEALRICKGANIADDIEPNEAIVPIFKK